MSIVWLFLLDVKATQKGEKLLHKFRKHPEVFVQSLPNIREKNRYQVLESDMTVTKLRQIRELILDRRNRSHNFQSSMLQYN